MSAPEPLVNCRGLTRRQFLELWESCVRYVRENEPYVHRYELHNGTAEQNGGKQQFVILEG